MINEIPVNTNKRLYYQYLGFINTLSIFNKNILNIDNFELTNQNITYEEFKNFELTIHLPLGKRVEYFFQFYINNTKTYKILKKNIQIISNKTTLGELDFIIQNIKTKDILHIELVYKYYLYQDNITNEIKRYIGANNHDVLEQRINKLKNKQFPILFNEQTRPYLEGINTKNIKQNICFLANIFIPINTTNKNFEIINKNCIKGNYINLNDFIKDIKYTSYKYFIPQKQDWLISPKYCNIWYDYEYTLKQINTHIKNNINPLIWIKNNNTFKLLFIINFI